MASAAAAEATTPPAVSPAMTEQMQKMQAIHDKVAAAKTPAERQAAMQEGMAAMREGLALMQKEGGPGCPGPGMGMGMAGSKDGAGMGMGMGGMGGMGGMMNMMMKMMDQQSSMMKAPAAK
ncbi:MAG: hypothetical protein WA173_05515 [Pseudomonas sp.]|uniref:hypothetical protein n=1 Tax=Pseudomonas sp. TaxID=306 RepID=UPI003BB59A44